MLVVRFRPVASLASGRFYPAKLAGRNPMQKPSILLGRTAAMKINGKKASRLRNGTEKQFL